MLLLGGTVVGHGGSRIVGNAGELSKVVLAIELVQLVAGVEWLAVVVGKYVIGSMSSVDV